MKKALFLFGHAIPYPIVSNFHKNVYQTGKIIYYYQFLKMQPNIKNVNLNWGIFLGDGLALDKNAWKGFTKIFFVKKIQKKVKKRRFLQILNHNKLTKKVEIRNNVQNSSFNTPMMQHFFFYIYLQNILYKYIIIISKAAYFKRHLKPFHQKFKTSLKTGFRWSLKRLLK